VKLLFWFSIFLIFFTYLLAFNCQSIEASRQWNGF